MADTLRLDSAGDYPSDEKHAGDNSHYVAADDVQKATSKEHELTVRQGLKAYPKAIAWSVLLSTAVVMEGYDTILVSLFSVLCGMFLLTPLII